MPKACVPSGMGLGVVCHGVPRCLRAPAHHAGMLQCVHTCACRTVYMAIVSVRVWPVHVLTDLVGAGKWSTWHGLAALDASLTWADLREGCRCSLLYSASDRD